jgi:WD40 repeat protein
MKRLFESVLIVSMVLVIVWCVVVINEKPEALPPFTGAEWHPTEDIVAFHSDTMIRVYTDRLRELFELNIPAEEADIYEIREIRISEIKWSPDGTKIAAHIFRSTRVSGMGRVVIWDVTTNPARLIFNIDNLQSPLAWSPDSQYIAAINLFYPNVEIYEISGIHVATFDPPPPNPFSLSWHPTDNHQLAINLISPDKSAVIIDPLVPDTPIVAEIASDGESVGVGFSPDGHFFAVDNFSQGEIEIRNENFELIDSFSYDFGIGYMLVGWLDAGIFVSYYDRTTRIFDISDTANPMVLQGINNPDWKSDGTRIAITDVSGIRGLDGKSGNVLQIDGTPLFAGWYHTKRLIPIMLLGVGLLALLMLGFRYKQFGSRKEKAKRQ